MWCLCFSVGNDGVGCVCGMLYVAVDGIGVGVDGSDGDMSVLLVVFMMVCMVTAVVILSVCVMLVSVLPVVLVLSCW